MQASWWQYQVQPWWARAIVGRRPALTLLRLAAVLVLYFAVMRPAFLTTRVWGHSMEPTYREGRSNLVYRWAYRRAMPRRGDVVVLRKEGTLQRILKRIVALPGERVAIESGRVFVNGEPLEEPYARGRGIRSRELTLQDGEYFAVGDNRDVSESGRVRLDEIVGRVVF